MIRTVVFLCVAAASSSHYEKPPCQADEMAGQLASGAVMCAPKCDSSGMCPVDVPTGTTAHPQCALKTTSGDKYCGLVCKVDKECPTEGQCTKPMPFLPTGICTYKAGLASNLPVEPAAAVMFEEFAAAVGRIYESTEERTKRYAIFVDNLKHIEKMQALDTGASYTHKSVFADWNVDEFSARNTFKPYLSQVEPVFNIDTNSSLPDAFDWRSKGAVTPVKNQGQCGSCWAFSTVANIEGVNFLATKQLLSLSEQELVDCDHSGDLGCQGGLPSNAMKFLIASKTGLETESQYSYTGRGGKCNARMDDERVFIGSWKQIPQDEKQMAAALVQYGPLSIGINAGPMQWYGGGIADPWSILCNPKALDHGVAIVAYGSQPKAYWTIKNSWGSSWGEKGYYRIVRGRNACGLASTVVTAVIGAETDNVVV